MEYRLIMVIAEATTASQTDAAINKYQINVLGLPPEWKIEPHQDVYRVIFYRGLENWTHYSIDEKIKKKILTYFSTDQDLQSTYCAFNNMSMPSFIPMHLRKHLCNNCERIKLDGIDVVLQITGCNEAEYDETNFVYFKGQRVLTSIPDDISATSFNTYLTQCGFPSEWQLSDNRNLVQVSVFNKDLEPYDDDTVWPTIMPLTVLRTLEHGPVLMHLPTVENFDRLKKQFALNKNDIVNTFDNIELVTIAAFR